ncbi:MAG: aminotransferase class V-fold PLP-dependent enzyme [Gemmatimonadota bacterium]
MSTHGPHAPVAFQAPADLAGRRTPLDLDPETFAAAGHRLVDEISALLGSLRDRPVAADVTPSGVRSVLDADRPLPEEGVEIGDLISRSVDALVPNSTYNGHPRFFGYITGAPAPAGILADFLASALNPNMGAWGLSPMASEIEAQAVRWIAELVGFPSGGDGIFVSGGNVANMLGFWAGRAAVADWDVRGSGLRAEDGGTLRAYVPRGTHTWIEKAADLSGLGTGSVRWIDATDQGRIDLGALVAAIERDAAAGDKPFLVVGTAGSVSTGVVDPLPALREICDRFGLWFHVDGAYGAFAAAAPNAPDDLRGLALADSVALDPHKWLYAPAEVGCTLVRDPHALLKAFSYRPDYYRFEGGAHNYFERGIQNSRGFRALKVWMQLQQAGAAGYRRMISEDIELARAFHGIAEAHPELEALTQSLSITTYRFVPSDLMAHADEPHVREYLNELNRQIQDRLERSGRAFVSHAVLDGVHALRMCIVNFRTTLGDVEALADITVELGRESDASLRSRLSESVA